MKPGKRFGLSAEQKIDVWRRWKPGQTLHEIGRAFGKEHSSIRCLVSRHGGIAPAVRRRAPAGLVRDTPLIVKQKGHPGVSCVPYTKRVCLETCPRQAYIS